MRKPTMIAVVFGSLLCAAWAWQDVKPVAAPATSLKDIALAYAGRMCTVGGQHGTFVQVEKKGAKHESFYKLDLIGQDFLRFTRSGVEFYVPFSALTRIEIDH